LSASLGRVADFHALRHTFISNLARSGAHPKVAQALGRHATVQLTPGRYSHTLVQDERAGIEALPDIEPTDDREAATGTDAADAPPARITQRITEAAERGGRGGNQAISGPAPDRLNQTDGRDRKPLTDRTLDRAGSAGQNVRTPHRPVRLVDQDAGFSSR
jgi:hypothetical protein